MGYKNKTQQGFLSLEIIMCLALMITLIFSALMLVFCNQAAVIDSGNNLNALNLAESRMEQARAVGFNFIPPADEVLNGFQTHLELTWLSDYAKAVTSRVSYNFTQRAQAVELDSIITDWQNSLGRDTCDLNFSADWQHPQARGVFLTTGNNPATDVDVLNKTAYVSTDSAVSSDSDIFAVSILNPDHLQVAGQLNTGPGLAAVHVAGKYIFAANTSQTGQLEIIDGSDFSRPYKKIKLGDLVSSVNDVAKSVFYYNQKVYLGLAKNSGPELFVFDVGNLTDSTDLSSFWPQDWGYAEIGSEVNDIYAFGDLIYLVSGGEKRLRIMQASALNDIYEVDSFVPNAGNSVQVGQSLAVLGDNIFLGRVGGLPNAHIEELYQLQKNDLQNPVKHLDIDDSINGMFLRGGLLFLATNNPAQELQIFKFGDLGFNIWSAVNLPFVPKGVDCEGEDLYLAMDGPIALQIVTPGN